ncbi:hypothetical protein FA95DRAFT_822731 [Auriscalpium vulgare]|uniref:Uncharacterized protein n=1 Tax=Auriscalpium vulgare TaxID=40419 RepID=A0ACB8S1I7_9AGAM|nr:hypothetical protein FA95DRAFT_822731 [Auriscalpium vulgare]
MVRIPDGHPRHVPLITSAPVIFKLPPTTNHPPNQHRYATDFMAPTLLDARAHGDTKGAYVYPKAFRVFGIVFISIIIAAILFLPIVYLLSNGLPGILSLFSRQWQRWRAWRKRRSERPRTMDRLPAFLDKLRLHRRDKCNQECPEAQDRAPDQPYKHNPSNSTLASETTLVNGGVTVQMPAPPPYAVVR